MSYFGLRADGDGTRMCGSHTSCQSSGPKQSERESGDHEALFIHSLLGWLKSLTGHRGRAAHAQALHLVR